MLLLYSVAVISLMRAFEYECVFYFMFFKCLCVSCFLKGRPYLHIVYVQILA